MGAAHSGKERLVPQLLVLHLRHRWNADSIHLHNTVAGARTPIGQLHIMATYGTRKRLYCVACLRMQAFIPNMENNRGSRLSHTATITAPKTDATPMAPSMTAPTDSSG